MRLVEIEQTSLIDDPLIPFAFPVVSCFNPRIRPIHLGVEIYEAIEEAHTRCIFFVAGVIQERFLERRRHKSVAFAGFGQ